MIASSESLSSGQRQGTDRGSKQQRRFSRDSFARNRDSMGSVGEGTESCKRSGRDRETSGIMSSRSERERKKSLINSKIKEIGEVTPMIISRLKIIRFCKYLKVLKTRPPWSVDM